jgi:hypothetical protein
MLPFPQKALYIYGFCMNKRLSLDFQNNIALLAKNNHCSNSYGMENAIQEKENIHREHSRIQKKNHERQCIFYLLLK